MATIKQLASFAVLSVNGGDRISYTFDEIDAETGDIVSSNNKGSFYCTDSGLKGKITGIRNFIEEKKLNEEG